MRFSAAARTAIATAVLIGASLLAGGPARQGEYALLDLRFAISRIVSAPDPPIPSVIVTISPESEERLGSTFSPEWRQWYPEMIATLNDAGATGIVWDAIFVASNPDADADVASAFASAQVIAGEDRVDQNNRVIEQSLLEAGWLSLILSQTGVPRRTPAGTASPPISSVAAGLAYESGLTATAPSDQESLWIDYSFDPSGVPTFQIADLLLAEDQRLGDEFATPLSVFADRLVFIGVDLPGEDQYRVPGSFGETVPGMLAHVVATWSYASERPISRLSGWVGRGAAILPAFLIVLAGGYARSRFRKATLILVAAIAILAPPAVFAAWRVWLPWTATMLFALAATIFVTVGQRISLARNYRTSLGFDPALLEQYSHSVKSLTEGVERHATVLCADVRNYTQFVTDNRPDEVQKVMTTYMATMEELVDEQGGYINKFVGDEIVAVFGFPLSEDEAEHRATRCAHNMLERLVELNAEWSVDDLPVLDGIGVGLDTGGLRFTNIGGVRRVQFDVIGGAINGASRLQGLTKQMARPLIVSAEVASEQNVFAVEQSAMELVPDGDVGVQQNEATDPDARFVFIGEVMIRGQGRRRLYGIEDGRG